MGIVWMGAELYASTYGGLRKSGVESLRDERGGRALGRSADGWKCQRHRARPEWSGGGRSQVEAHEFWRGSIDESEHGIGRRWAIFVCQCRGWGVSAHSFGSGLRRPDVLWNSAFRRDFFGPQDCA